MTLTQIFLFQPFLGKYSPLEKRKMKAQIDKPSYAWNYKI